MPRLKPLPERIMNYVTPEPIEANKDVCWFWCGPTKNLQAMCGTPDEGKHHYYATRRTRGGYMVRYREKRMVRLIPAQISYKGWAIGAGKALFHHYRPDEVEPPLNDFQSLTAGIGIFKGSSNPFSCYEIIKACPNGDGTRRMRTGHCNICDLGYPYPRDWVKQVFPCINPWHGAMIMKNTIGYVREKKPKPEPVMFDDTKHVLGKKSHLVKWFNQNRDRMDLFERVHCGPEDPMNEFTPRALVLLIQRKQASYKWLEWGKEYLAKKGIEVPERSNEDLLVKDPDDDL